MNDRGPQYWRSVNTLARLIMLVGFGLVFWGTQDMKAHRNDPPPAASPGGVCTINGQPMPCSSFPNNGVGFSDGAGRPVRQPEAQAVPGTFQLGLGFLVMVGGLIPGVIAGNKLGRIKNAVMDRAYTQMHSGEGVRCPHCGFVNQNVNQFCGRCGKPLAH